MGTPYLTTAEQDSFGNEFYNLHVTFGQPIVIYKTAKETVISTNPSHSFIFDQAPTNDVEQITVQAFTGVARVLYGKREDLGSFATSTQNRASDQLGIRLEEGEVRIKLDPTGAAYLQGCERVEFNGTIFNVITAPRPHGLFVTDALPPKFYDFYLKKLN